LFLFLSGSNKNWHGICLGYSEFNVFNNQIGKKTMNKSTQQGFTLIELMIVVAIIGILASIALPAYQQYTAKSKFTEVVMATNAIKSAVEVCAQTEGGLADCDSDPAVTAAVSGASEGTYVSSVSVDTNSKITATATSSGGLSGETYILAPTYSNGAVTWSVDSNSTCLSKGYCK
jgi:type IV pilus assembly protein PilA